MLVMQGKMSHEKYSDIIEHGENILKAAGYDKFKPDYNIDGKEAEWNEYHLLIDGKKYFSKFKNCQEWYDFYNK